MDEDREERKNKKVVVVFYGRDAPDESRRVSHGDLLFVSYF